ncbi:MAG: hypothetical protein CM1200mP28_16140 [Deltaproteobacteria bacterium]|nr:MAG: hypothetical protein CM1200mP28_16140 [Deltaproteobacteria bacterium]
MKLTITSGHMPGDRRGLLRMIQILIPGSMRAVMGKVEKLEDDIENFSGSGDGKPEFKETGCTCRTTEAILKYMMP